MIFDITTVNGTRVSMLKRDTCKLPLSVTFVGIVTRAYFVQNSQTRFIERWMRTA
jgi:hypothetical protein